MSAVATSGKPSSDNGVTLTVTLVYANVPQGGALPGSVQINYKANTVGKAQVIIEGNSNPQGGGYAAYSGTVKKGAANTNAIQDAAGPLQQQTSGMAQTQPIKNLDLPGWLSISDRQPGAIKITVTERTPSRLHD